MRRPIRRAFLASASLVLCPGIAAAQTATAPPPDPRAPVAANTGDAVDEIVVTATRRSTNLQQVPATVEAVPAETLKALNITSALQLTAVTPGLVVITSAANNFYLRGVGYSSTGYNDGEVAVYVDGLYLANPAMSLYSFNNIDQVEVLKGPQGTLYGRNVTGGLIAVTTRDPSPKLRGDAALQYANYDTITQNFYGSVPITDTLAANVAVYHSQQNKGWGINLFTGHQDDRQKETGVEAKLQWKPASGTKVTASFIYDYNNRDYSYAYEVYPGTVATDGTVYNGHYRSDTRTDPTAPFRAYIGTLKIEQDLGFANLLSLTGYQTSNQHALFDAGPQPGLPVRGQNATTNNIYESNRTWSQEFQLSSRQSASRVNWLLGAFYYNDHTTIGNNSSVTCVGAVCAPGVPTSNYGYPTIESYSGFGDVSYRFLKATTLTVGLRYTDETRGLTGLITPLAGFPNSVAVIPGSVAPAGGVVPATGVTYPGEPYSLVVNGVVTPQPGIPTRLHFDKLTYRLVLAQTFGDNIHAYVSDNLGFKAGAFNANVFTNPPALPETLHAYEAGVKTELFNRRVRLNVAGFYYDFKNVQVRSGAPPALQGTTILQNAATERMQGIDADYNIVVTRDFSINGGIEYLDATYKNYPGATCATPATTVVNGVTLGTPIILVCNLAGRELPYAPSISGSVGFIYKLDTSVGAWALVGNDHFASSYPLVADGSVRQGQHHLIDASLTWTAPDRRFDVQLFVRNLTNQYTYTAGLVTSIFHVSPGAPRTYGITLGAHY